jgi:hypothetical protein
MYIRRKVFSLLQNEAGEVKTFSTTDYELNENNEVRMFSSNEKKKSHKVALEDVKSHRGLGRAILFSPIDAGGGLVGGYAAKDEADKADLEGADDKEIIRRAGKKGGKYGAIAGGTVLALRNSKAGLPGMAIGGAVGAGLGALGGRNTARVNTKARLNKRAYKERRLERDKEEGITKLRLV